MGGSGTARVAGRLREAITGGECAVGSALPPERSLAEAHGVSRTTVRAALAALAAEGLVERRVGRGGGTFVSAPGPGPVTAALRQAVGRAGFPAADLAEARLELEPRCAALAADRISAEARGELAGLQRAMVRARTRSEFFEANARFHSLIAHSSGNAVLAAVVEGLHGPIRELTDDPLRIREPELRETVRAHERILAAFSDGDAVAAEAAMRDHLRAHAEIVAGPVGGLAPEWSRQ
ncbi:FadR/GntR family transcriptional regulator [Brevibacterium album]|uniref:FadR/GntR family transcriptional regulator n=1 Tax=Brevibacterium album TaxID=417948 RepID=UPI00041565A0|nr:FCD domain-containing protein [Brevibacterium album]